MAVASHQVLDIAIQSRFHSAVASLETPDLPTEYDNAKIEHPKDSIWARVNIRNGNTDHVQIGKPNTWRNNGVLIVQLFGPINTGMAQLNILADKVVVAFRRVTAGGVTYRSPSKQQLGRTRDWWQINVNCPFFADTMV